MNQVLIIDDEPKIVSFISRALRGHGIDVDGAHDGKSGLALAKTGGYGLVVLDLLMPGTDGVSVLRDTMAARPGQQVLVLSALSDVETKVRCLDLGAADFLAKPFSLAELLARVRARLHASSDESIRRIVEVGEMILDLRRRVVVVGRVAVQLSTREFLLLEHFMRHPDEVFTREELLSEVWGLSFDPGTNVVDVCVKRLRTKLGKDVVETVRMSDTASRLGRYRLEIAWALFSAANLALLPAFGEWETIPFHFVWVSLTLLYGLRVWGLKATAAVLLVVSLVTGLELAWMASLGRGELAEVTEVPLMAGMFAAMVWHARRRQAAVEELRRAGERERDFVRDASHQLRTPITVARGHVELIRDAGLDPEVAADADIVLEELDRLSTISDRLLLLAAAERPGFIVSAPVDIQRLAVSAVDRWCPVASRRWEVDARAEGTVHADRERVAYALDALIENAIKFTIDGDTIGIVCRAEGSTAILEVYDTGFGIQQGELESVFERFASGTSHNGSHSRGTGLGLSIVKAVAEAHGGFVGATAPSGGGARFRIALPGFRGAGELESPIPALIADEPA